VEPQKTKSYFWPPKEAKSNHTTYQNSRVTID